MNHIARIREKLDEYGIGAMLITTEENRRYAADFHSTDGTVLVTKKSAYLYVDSRYIEAAEKGSSGVSVLMTDRENTCEKLINDCLDRECIASVGFEEAYVSVAEHKKYLGWVKGREFREAGELLSSLRRTKDEDEIKSLTGAQRIAEKALDDVLKIIKVGMTEKDVAAELIYRMYRHGAENVSFDPIVVSGAKSSMPHGVPGDNVIKKNDFLTMDFGCKLNGYCSDMTRTVAVGGATEEMRKVYATVLEAQEAGIAAARAGVTGRTIDAAARKVIDDAGYGKYFGHSFGHGVGLLIHETPNASPSSDAVMQDGAVISAEPGIYIPGKFGVRIEDVIIIRDNGCENITKAEKSLIIL